MLRTLVAALFCALLCTHAYGASNRVLESGRLRFELSEDPYRYQLSRDGKILLKHNATRITAKGKTERVERFELTASGDGVLRGILIDGAKRRFRVEFELGKHLRIRLNNTLDSPREEEELRNVAVQEIFSDLGDAVYGAWVYPWNKKKPFADPNDPTLETHLNNRGVEAKLLGGESMGRGGNMSSTRAPFLLSEGGYAIWVNTLAEGRLSIGIEGRNSFQFFDNQLEYFVFAADTPLGLLKEYRDQAGAAKLPPPWALGVSWWRDEMMASSPKADLMEVMEEDLSELRKLGIHPSLMILDRPHSTIGPDDRELRGWGAYPDGNFRFDFPIDRITVLRAQGLSFMAWTTNRVVGQLREAAAGFLFDHDGVNSYAVDLRKPGAAAFWEEKLSYFTKLGIQGFKIDRGDEYGHWDYAGKPVRVWDVPPHAQNYHSFHVPKLQSELLAKSFGADHYTISRAAYDRAREYGTSWSADTFGWSGLREAVKQTIRAGLINFPVWGTDVGGYDGGGVFFSGFTPELFVRWSQFAAYSPQMQLLFGDGRTPWRDFKPAELAAFRQAVQEKQDLLPYLSSLAYEANKSGAPIARALFLQFPGFYTDHWQDYFLGENLLVAPVFQSREQAAARAVVLPPGRWLDYHGRQQVYEGGNTTVVALGLERIPVFVKEGAIIPRGDVFRFTNPTPDWKPRLRIELFPAREGSSEFLYHAGEEPRLIRMESRNGVVSVSAPAFSSEVSFELYGKSGVTKLDFKAGDTIRFQKNVVSKFAQ